MNQCLKFGFAYSILVLSQFCAIVSLNAQSCEKLDCTIALELASEYFAEKNFECVETVLTECNPEEIAKEAQKVRAYEFLIAAYWQSAKKDSTEAFKKEQRKNAVDNIEKLLELTGNKYEPKGAILRDPELSERVIKIKRDRRPWYQKYWYVWTPVLASGVGAYMLTRENPPKQLPGPPKVDF